jgi:hypothetical protein
MEANLRIYYRLIVIVVLLASAFSFSASQTVAPDRDSSGPGLPFLLARALRASSNPSIAGAQTRL